MNIENSLLIPSADPIIAIVECEACNGTGAINICECDIEDCNKHSCEGCAETLKMCGDCRGLGEVEIWS